MWDAREGHAYYTDKTLPSGGELYADVTTGYGPECFAIPGPPAAYPYRLQVVYFNRGAMGYGLGKLQIIEHDGAGELRFEDRPFVLVDQRGTQNLGALSRPLIPAVSASR